MQTTKHSIYEYRVTSGKCNTLVNKCIIDEKGVKQCNLQSMQMYNLKRRQVRLSINVSQ